MGRRACFARFAFTHALGRCFADGQVTVHNF
jgi:hypothetical protein